jgi:hypothetical protein
MGKLMSKKTGSAAVAKVIDSIDFPEREAITAAGMVLVEATKLQLSKPGSGRIRHAETKRLGRGATRYQKDENGDRKRVRVQRGNPRTKIHGATRASAPGESPAPDRGVLRNSIQFEWEPSKVEGYVGSGLPQAPALNNGTTNAGRGHNTVILPRPFMEPARVSCQDRMTDAVVLTLNTKKGDITQQHGPAFAGPAGGGRV